MPRIGVQFTENSVRAVQVRGGLPKPKPGKKSEEKLPEGAMQDGLIMDPEKCVESLKKLRKSIKASHIHLCLPVNEVYTQLIRSGGGKKALREAINKTIPEPYEDLIAISSRTIKTTEGRSVCVAAVRKDVVKAYTDASKAAGFKVRGLAPSSIALGGLVKKKKTFLLVNLEDAAPTLTVFYKGFPIDEALLTSTAAVEVIKNIQAIMQEYKDLGIPIGHVAVHGATSASDAIKKAFAPPVKPPSAKASKGKKKKKTKKKEEKEVSSYAKATEEKKEVITVEHLLPHLKQGEHTWAGTMVAALKTSKLDLRHRRWKKPQTLLALLFVAFVASAGYFVWVMGVDAFVESVRGLTTSIRFF